jgi:hypothetical protein
MRPAVTALLRETSLRRGERTWLSELVGRDVRTLWDWERKDASASGPGRPAHGRRARWQALRAVARQRRQRGPDVGWRELDAALPEVPTRLIQELLPRLQERARRRQAARLSAQRVHVEVLKKDVLHSQDTTHVGTAEGRAVWSEVSEDAGSMKTLDAPVRARATTAEDVIAQLERLEAQGRRPLVWATDNGKAYTAEKTERWLAAHHVVHLISLPHTPQHNPWVERKHRDVKAVSGLGRGVVLDSVEEAARRWSAAIAQIDGYRLRARLGCRTADEIDGSVPSWEGVVDRRELYAEVCRAREQAVLGLSGARARRRAVREATWRVLERYELVRRTRGGAPLTSLGAEGIS